MTEPTKSLTEIKTKLPHDFYMHSCATFQGKIWICAPFVRGNKVTMKKCWKFDGENIEEGPALKNGHYSSTIAKIVVDGEVRVRLFDTYSRDFKYSENSE